jgi:16S rRNA (guanine527-N7)-methyltransferase
MQQGIPLIRKYFPSLTPLQEKQLEKLASGLVHWNERINVISRKDIANLWEHHILHSLTIAAFFPFPPGTTVIDVGTGGGLPGLPLAILFPGSRFTLLDSIGKKIRVVDELITLTGINNAEGVKGRSEEIKGSYDIVTGRGVTRFNRFWQNTRHLLTKKGNAPLQGILYLTGGQSGDEIRIPGKKVERFAIKNRFEEPFFETKEILRLQI